LDWQRQELADAGMLDTPRWGVWHVTALGLRWLQENPAETNLNPARAACARAPQRRERASQSRKVVSFHIRGHSGTLSVEKVLTVAREALAAGLPAEAADYRSWAVVVDGRRIGLKWLFRQATGLDSFNTSHARDILGRRLGFECVQQENALSSSRNARRAPHSASGEEATWLDVARREVRSVRDFLAGRAARPSDERLCDMVQFCYTFGLYSEARDLFPLVDQTLVNVWLYERIRRLAMVSEPKASH
ncbi:MAG TPA: hypothetical protein PLG21_14040, partial [Anaerolineae bacterium]|nr:hypothetical protein [Anaerolineae bacterium]